MKITKVKKTKLFSLTLSEAFEYEASINPERIAIRFNNKTLTYRELNHLANQLAHYLKEFGINVESFVSICVPPGIESIIAILGILKAGGTYVPIDPIYPAERVEHILNDSSATVLLTHESLSERFSKFSLKLININLDSTDWKSIKKYSKTNLKQSAKPNNLAYVIYTSGSTGVPKGVMIEHQNVLNLFQAIPTLFDFTQEDIWTLFHSIAFDFSVWEIWGALLYGSELIIIPYEITRSSEDFYHLVKKFHVTVLNQTPMAFKQFITVDEMTRARPADTNQDFSLRYVIFGGEALNLQMLKPWLDYYGDRQPKLINMYGITEITIHATYRALSMVDLQLPLYTSPIGYMLPHLQGFILDEHLQRVSEGETGELCITGSGVARGYLNKPELTAEKFITTDFVEGKLYRSGDLVKLDSGNELNYIGRMDKQVKIRGFRIELGEIESQLLKNPHISQAVVMAREDEPGNKYLAAYLALKDKKYHTDLFKKNLIESLQSKLPPYMLPTAIVILDKIYMTPHGKVDYQKLLKPSRSDLIISSSFSPPKTTIEKKLAKILIEVLGLSQIGIDDNFFEIGGNSLLVTKIMSKLSEEFEFNFPFHWFFELPTIKNLSEKIEQAIKEQYKYQHPQVTKQTINTLIPLSYEQEGLWLIEQLESLGAAYNVNFAFKIRDDLNINALEKAINSIITRHNILRTHFTEQPSGSIQTVEENFKIKINTIDLTKLSKKSRKNKICDLLTNEAIKTFDLKYLPLIRVTAIKSEENSYIILITIHHIIFDAWSIPILFNELEKFYQHEISNKSTHAPTLPIQYADFSIWQRQWLQDTRLNNLIEYWKKQLEGCKPLLELPYDYMRPNHYTFDGDEYHFHIPNTISKNLEKLCHETHSTFFMGALAILALLMNKYSGQDDIIIGTPIANRHYKGVEHLIGYFTNTLPLRFRFTQKYSVKDWLKQVREIALSAYKHQDLPFSKLVEKLKPHFEKNYNPLYQVLLVVFDGEEEILRLTNAESKLAHVKTHTSKIDLIFFIRKTNKGIKGWIEYNTHLFKRSRIKAMAIHFRELMRNFTPVEGSQLSDLNILSESERYQLLTEWNATHADYPQNSGIHQFFEKQAEITPKHIAIEFEGTSLTYSELNQKANCLAYELQRRGINHTSIVAICAAPSLEMIIGVLAVLKTNAAYLPLDSALPEERIYDIVQDCQATLFLTQSQLLKKFSKMPIELLLFSEKKSNINSRETINLSLPSKPDNTAYVIYTSGTTGKPKGIALTHKTLTNLISWQKKQSPGHHNIALFSAFSFDVATQVIFFALSSGSTIQIIPEEKRRDPFALFNFLIENKITMLFIPPAILQNISQCFEIEHKKIHSLKEIIVAGDALRISPAIRHFFESHPQCRLTNQYGPSETHVATSHSLPREVQHWLVLPSLGQPIDNAKIYLLDNYLNPVPIGINGEIYIGGDMLAQGYMGQAELTATKFIPNPFQKDPNARIYRTGDIARYNERGELEFITRADHQVKIRGYRIELHEIEITLETIEPIELAAVVLNKDKPNDLKLVAYLVTKNNKSIDTAIITNQLKKYLPTYMIPVKFIVLEKMPMSVNGKIDKKTLPKPDFSDSKTRTSYVMPRNKIEEELSFYWSELLDIKKISIFDNFFELGGHSLLATQLILKIKSQFGTLISLSHFFNQPTIAALAKLIEPTSEGEPAIIDESNITDEDSHLDPSIIASHDILTPANQPKAILLTGANGFLGIYLLNELLLNTKAKIYCLIRAEDDFHAQLRLTSSLEKYHFQNWVVNSRIIPIAGDLAKPNLGISIKQFTELENEIDSIYHNGAFVHHIYDYTKLRASNVLSTLELIKFAARKKPKRIHFISTLATACETNKQGHLIEKFPGPNSQCHGGGYVISKWVSERLLAQANERGFATSIYRPAHITGDSTTGIYANENNHLLLFIKGCTQLGFAPRNWGKVDMLPVDFVAKAIVMLSLQEENHDRVFHLNNSKLLSWDTLFSWVEQNGYSVHLLPRHHWLDDHLAKIDEKNALYPLLSLYLTQETKGEQEETTALNTQTEKSLNKLGIAFPTINHKLFMIYLNYLRDWLEN